SSSLRSNCSMTASLTADRLASLARLISTSARAARHCEPVIMSVSLLLPLGVKWRKLVEYRLAMPLDTKNISELDDRLNVSRLYKAWVGSPFTVRRPLIGPRRVR